MFHDAFSLRAARSFRDIDAARDRAASSHASCGMLDATTPPRGSHGVGDASEHALDEQGATRRAQRLRCLSGAPAESAIG